MNTQYLLEYADKKTHIWVKMLILLLSLPITPITYASSIQLEKVGFSTLTGNRVQLNFDFTGTAPQPTDFATDNPARIVLDFTGISLGLHDKTKAIGSGAVQSVSAVETNGRVRLVINLVQKVPYIINTANNKVLLIVENVDTQMQTSLAPQAVQTPTTEPAAPTHQEKTPPTSTTPSFCCTPPPQPSALAEETKTTTAVESPTAQVPSIQNIDFRRTQKGAGHVEVILSDPSIVVTMKEEGNDIIVEFLNTHLPSKLDKRLDVVDFSTPVTFIDTTSKAENIKMVISAKGNYEHLAYQSENKYVVEVEEVVLVEEKEGEVKIADKKYEGQKISFDFQNIEIRAALLLLTEVVPGLDLNIITSPEVKGNVALRLKNVPWDQALDIILEANNLGKKQVGNVLMIDLKKNIAEEEQRILSAQQKITQLEPLRTEFIQINYAKASGIEKLLKQTGEHSFLSSRGSVSIDERTNHLIIQDTASNLADIRKLITSLDTPIRQVLIESKIVIAEDSFRKSLGVKFGYSANQDLGGGYGAVFGGRATGDTTFAGPTAFGDGTEGFIVRLPESVASGTTAAVGLAIGKIGSYLLQLELSALQEEGRGEIVSSPRLITGNQQTATILQGQQIPYTPAAGVGATADVQFVDAVMKLEVTPQITPDDRIIMDLTVNKDEPGVASGGQLPINKREIKTQVLVDNGETVVLGGVYEQRTNQSVTRVPFLSDLPFIGSLFKRRSDDDSRTELLIFVTPRIIKETS